LVRVTTGRVRVVDLAHGRSITLSAGDRYLARRR
jgi:hypothetical protein